jgi:conjugal transfer pilus assembly protein TraW
MLLLLIVYQNIATASIESNNITNDQAIIKDYGIRGNLFRIAEESLLDEIIDKLKAAQAEGELEKLQVEFISKVKEKVLRPNPVLNISKAVKDRSWTYDPTYTQATAITDDKGKIIIAAGTNINALDKLKWGEPLVFIDGEDKEQIEWVAAVSGKIVLVNGTPLQLSKYFNRAVYFDQGGILCRRFKIEYTPALVEQSGNLLVIREIKL